MESIQTAQISKRILVLCDDQWHPAEVIEKGLQYFPYAGYQFDFVRTAKDIFLPEDLTRYDVILIAKCNQINASNTQPWFEETVTEVGPDQFRAFVEAGGSLLFVHSGACYHKNLLTNCDARFEVPHQKMTDLIGCEFLGHPLRSPMTVHPIATDHPILSGIPSFTERDEHYQLRFVDDNILPLFRTESENGEPQTGGYIRPLGKGRVIVLLPGHTLAMWKHPIFQKLLRNTFDYMTAQ